MLFRAKDEADAVRIANDSPFGLGGSVFTSNPAHGADVARQIETGMVFVNHPTKVEADLLFGGIKRSGYDNTPVDDHHFGAPSANCSSPRPNEKFSFGTGISVMNTSSGDTPTASTTRRLIAATSLLLSSSGR